VSPRDVTPVPLWGFYSSNNNKMRTIIIGNT
jgi:hypothetical protein